MLIKRLQKLHFGVWVVKLKILKWLFFLRLSYFAIRVSNTQLYNLQDLNNILGNDKK